jgi:hypothetical protein
MENHKYLQSLQTLEALCQMATRLSLDTSGRTDATWREKYGSHIFGKICMTAIAILKLLPKSRFNVAVNNMEIWDISSVCTLARSLIDAYYSFNYLIIEKVDKHELGFRFTLWSLHSESERLKMLELIKSTSNKLDEIRKNIEELTRKLRSNKFYKSLDSKAQKKFSSGEIGIFLTNTQISKNAGVNPNYYKAVYKYLSNYVHTYSFSISQIALFKAGDLESLRLLQTAVGYCTGYLCLAIRDFTKLFPDQRSNLSIDIIETIKDWEYIVGSGELNR